MNEKSETNEKPKLTKEERREQERTLLLSRVSEGRFDDFRSRVAYILSHFQDTRNSDTLLAIKYWQVFNPDLLDYDSISFDSFHKLPRYTSITRARAKIQNEFKLYEANPEVQEFRIELEKTERKEQAEDKPSESAVMIYCDESGKSGKFKIVGSVWINDGYQEFQLFNNLNLWKKRKKIDKEFHFTELREQDCDNAIEFVEEALGQAAYLGFKSIIVDSSHVRGKKPDAIIYDLHYQLILQGIEHEVKTKRFSLPRMLRITKDSDDGADKLRLNELVQKLKTECRDYFEKKAVIDDVDAEHSHSNIFIQLADLFSGSLNRLLNEVSAPKNHKYAFAVKMLGLLGIENLETFQNFKNDFAKVIFL